MNTITIVGNLTRDPKEHDGKFGKFITFTLASNFSKDEDPLWISCIVNNISEYKNMMEYIKKGTRLMVCGHARSIDIYKKTDGSDGASLKVKVISMKFISSGKPGTSGEDSNSTTFKNDNFIDFLKDDKSPF